MLLIAKKLRKKVCLKIWQTFFEHPDKIQQDILSNSIWKLKNQSWNAKQRRKI